MDEHEWLAKQFEAQRTRMRAVAVAKQFSGRAYFAQKALVNGAVGLMWAPSGRPRVVFGFTMRRAKIVAIDILADPARLRPPESQRSEIVVPHVCDTLADAIPSATQQSCRRGRAGTFTF